MSETQFVPEPVNIVQPKVYLVGNTEESPDGIAPFLQAEGLTWKVQAPSAAEGLVEVAGRLCYMSYEKPRPGGNAAYLQHILEVGHGSVLEHATFNLIITGVSRSFTHELVRHRAGFAYSQLSQRFVDESACAFVEPPIIAEDPELHAIWMHAVTTAQLSYRELSNRLFTKLAGVEDKTLRRKRSREAARSVLPNATETKIFVTGNGRSLRHFIEMRASVGADAEIRRVAIAVLRLLQAEAPNLFGDYALVVEDGVEIAKTLHTKV